MRTLEERLAAVGKQPEDEDSLSRPIRIRVGFRTGPEDAQGVRSGVTGGGHARGGAIMFAHEDRRGATL